MPISPSTHEVPRCGALLGLLGTSPTFETSGATWPHMVLVSAALSARSQTGRRDVQPKITLYTNTACPFAQRVWIALEASRIPFEKVDVHVYGSGGFDKSQLKKVEEAGGLSPKGYIPVLRIDNEVIRESSVLVERIADLSEEISGAISLTPENAETAQALVQLCNTLPKCERSRELDVLMHKANEAVAASGGEGFLAGMTFSTADACLLPFLQRVEDTIPSDAKHLRAYMERAHKQTAFAKTVVSTTWWWW